MLVSLPTCRLLRFDNFELDLRAGELRKGGVKLRLQGQPIQVLTALLSSPGDLVTREEMRAQVWPAETFVDFDHGLHNAIARIRETLGDSAEKPRYIETLPRRGYRFVGRVERVGSQEIATAAAVEPVVKALAPENSVEKHGPLKFVLWIVLTLIASLLVIAPSVLHRSSVPVVRSIAVLPLDNFSGDPAQEYFADGMTDELITDLAKVGALKVVSRTSVMRYKNTKKGLPEIARELNVDGIIEGSVTRSGQRVRITAQLLYGPTDKHLWAETYERDMGDILKLQGEVADAIAQQVRAQLTPSQAAQLRGKYVLNPAAYDAYLRGHVIYTNDNSHPEALKKAQHYFEESLHHDPNFALAYAGLAGTYVYSAFAGALPRNQAYQSAKQALAKAVELDDTIGEAHDVLGTLSSSFEWDWQVADREYARAIALAPSYSCAHEDRAIFLAQTGRRAEAIAEIKKIDQLDYGFSSAQTETWAYFELRDYPSLIEAAGRGLLLNPNDSFQHYALGVGYEGTGKLREAISEYQKAIEISGDSRSTVALAHAYSTAGKKAEALKILRDLELKSKQTSTSPLVLATIYAGLGETDKAFVFLERAYSEKSLDLAAFIRSDLALDGLRSDPRFRELLQRIGLTG